MPLQINGATSGSTTINATDAVTATLTLPGTTGTLLSTANPQSGGVIQVVQTVKTDTFSTTSTSFIDVTGLTVTITPKFSTSKILIIAQITNTGNNTRSAFFKLAGGNTSSYVGNSSGSKVQAVFGGNWNNNETGVIFSSSISYVDSPATSSPITYSVQTRVGSTSGNPSQVNYGIGEADTADYVRGASSIIVLEIAA